MSRYDSVTGSRARNSAKAHASLARPRFRAAFVSVAALAAATALTAPAMARSTSPSATTAATASLPSLPPNNLALTPPMGWNSWYQYRCRVNESAVLANARALVSSGLARIGYKYVVLDDCWMAPHRTSSGALRGDPNRFPHGIAWLAAQVHALGLKFGVYESYGTITCQKLPGSYGHYLQDASTFANWGVDFLKFDYCGSPAGTNSVTVTADNALMAADLRATGRPIVYSEELPVAADDANPGTVYYLPYVSASALVSNMWRVAPDLQPDFASSVFGSLSNDIPLGTYARPGAWNDLDMLLAGSGNPHFRWSVQQQQTQMNIWAEMASPLIDSSNLASMTAATKTILGNAEVVAIDQDPLGVQGRIIRQQGPVDVLVKPLSSAGAALLLANTGTTPQRVTVPVASLRLPTAADYSVHDVWTDVTKTISGVGTVTVSVGPHQAKLLRIKPLSGL